MAKNDIKFVDGYEQDDLRQIIDNEQAQNGGTWTTVIPVSVTLCPTTRCSKHCS